MGAPPDRPEPSAEGKRAQCASLVARYREPLIRYFVRRGMPESVGEDLAHDTFVRLFALQRTEHVENEEAYLFQTASSVLNDHLRKVRVRRSYAPFVKQDYELVAEAETPLHVLEGKQAVERFEAALAELKPRTRDIFLLSRMEGLSYTKIAVRYGVTASAIEKHMAFAISHLVHRLRDAR